MFKKILGTTGSKLITAIIGVLIIILNTNLLGREGVGTIGLIVFSILIVIMVSNLVGGTALVYLAPRFSALALLLPSYVWALVISVVCTFVLHLFGLLPEGYFWHIMTIAAIEALTSANLNYLVGIQRIRSYNLISIVQYFCLGLALLLLYFAWEAREVISYVYALYIGAGVAMIWSFAELRKVLSKPAKIELKPVLRELFRYGSYVQTAALLHLLTLRVNYFFIDAFAGRAALGVFDVNSKINDGIWLPGKSIALVQYSTISNADDKEYSILLTQRLWKILILLTIFGTAILAALPSGFYEMVFGEGFGDVRHVLILMIPGIIGMASNTIFAHYFSGIGKHYLNSIGSALSMALTLVGGILLIKPYGLEGAAYTASLAFLGVAVYSFIVFHRITKAPWKGLVPSKADVRMFVELLRNSFK